MTVLRWAGSKRKLLSTLKQTFSDVLVPGGVQTFWEPFVGSMSVALMVAREFRPKRIVCSDANWSLINFYRHVRDDMETLRQKAIELGALNYYDNRDAYNQLLTLDKAEKTSEHAATEAALFYVLNGTCFNGLFRVNGRGLFNVPFGQREFRINDAYLGELRDALKSQTIEIYEGTQEEFFEFFSSEMLPGDLLYADPPYDGTFSNYQACYGKEDHKKLFAYCHALRHRGIHVVCSNSENAFTNDLWMDFNVRRIQNNRSFDPSGNERGRVQEILVTSW
jgi:DNA adenine methylase